MLSYDQRYDARTQTLIRLAAGLARDTDITKIPDYFNSEDREEILVRALRIRTDIYVKTGELIGIIGFPTIVNNSNDLYDFLYPWYDVDYILREGSRNLPIPLNSKLKLFSHDTGPPLPKPRVGRDTGLPGPLPPQPIRSGISGNLLPGESSSPPPSPPGSPGAGGPNQGNWWDPNPGGPGAGGPGAGGPGAGNHWDLDWNTLAGGTGAGNHWVSWLNSTPGSPVDPLDFGISNPVANSYFTESEFLCLR